MNTTRIIAALSAGWLGVAMAQQQGPEAPWMRQYQGPEATGEQVIGLWQFLPGAEVADSSGNGHALSLRGVSRFVEGGRFGSCLESFPAGTDNDKAMGATAGDHDALSPKGAFTLELWLKPKPELMDRAQAFLVDKKYFHYAKDLPEANTDYGLYLQRRGTGQFQMTATLGFGTDSVWAHSKAFELKADTWHHLAYAYDGAGVSRFFLNGDPVGKSVHEGRGAVAPGRHPFVIGDRVGSTHVGCPAFIDQVRLCKGVLPPFSGTMTVGVRASRTAFRRMEPDASVEVSVENDATTAAKTITVDIVFGGTTRQERVGDLAAGAKRTLSIPVDTRLKPGTYPLRVSARGEGATGPFQRETAVDILIVPRKLPNRMPVVMWGGGDFENLAYVGFTHQLDHLVDYGKVWKAGEPTQAMESAAVDERAERLNTYLANGLEAAVYLYPGRWIATNKDLAQHLRVDRSGKPYPHENISASHPDVQAFGYNVGASVAQTFGRFPALTASLVHSEIRDSTALSYHDFELEAARKALGQEMPALAVAKNGVSYRIIPGFPANRVIPDDHPILRFYSWFWKDGDGWNPLHTQVHKGLKSTGRDDLWTFYDPAVRVPSVWGSGGGVDVVSQWTYSYPDPIKIGQATDELFAMADGRPGQQVMKMTQVIWYRSGTAPDLPEDENARAQWEKDIPDAKFITIAPDHMREAFWSKISRPIRGIMYHGWGSLFPGSTSGYRYTNPETKEVLRELVSSVVHPLGPTLLQVPDRPADVAMLESFASQVFAGRGSFGWSGSWEARMHLILQWASLQPRIIYDEHVVRDGLDAYKVLVMPSCDVLTETVVAAIQRFQARGGIVVADEFLCPALSPDIIVTSCGGKGEARETKAEMLLAAAALRSELDAFYQRYADSSNPEVVPRMRSFGNTDYLFAVNDKRTYGDYVGHHRKVMEKGLPNQATLSVARAKGHVYDLVAHRETPAVAVDGSLRIETAFGPGEGKLFMVTEQPIGEVVCAGPRTVARAKTIELEARVMATGGGTAIGAVVPVDVQVRDSDGQSAEGSGFYGAENGRLTIALDIAPNDALGTWAVEITELASGKKTRTTFVVE